MFIQNANTLESSPKILVLQVKVATKYIETWRERPLRLWICRWRRLLGPDLRHLLTLSFCI
jgi:hypothetical protein